MVDVESELLMLIELPEELCRVRVGAVADATEFKCNILESKAKPVRIHRRILAGGANAVIFGFGRCLVPGGLSDGEEPNAKKSKTVNRK